MKRAAEPDPRVVVRQSVEVTLSTEEVSHALRCWLAHHLTSMPSYGVPHPKGFSDIAVLYQIEGDGGFYGVTLKYEPTAAEQHPTDAPDGRETGR